MSTPTATAERALAHITEMADENRQLRADLCKAEEEATKWRDRHGRVLEVDDGSFAHVVGMNDGDDGEEEVLMEFYDGKGGHLRRKYKLCGEW